MNLSPELMREGAIALGSFCLGMLSLKAWQKFRVWRLTKKVEKTAAAAGLSVAV